MIRGRIFREMIRVSARESELQTESRSYGPKVGVTARQTPQYPNRIAQKGSRTGFPEGPRTEKIQSREAILKKSSFQYGMKFSIENGFFTPGSSLAAEKQGLGLKSSIENEIFKPRMKFSSANENFVRGGMVLSCVRARMIFFDPRALWV